MKGYEQSKAAVSQASAGWRGVIHRDGVYYAELAVTSQAAPMHVALHGITSEGQAALALQALLGLQEPAFAFVGK